MSDITRSEAIKQLRLLKADIINGLSFVSKTKDKHAALESLDMAIESMETDEAYQLEYERTTKSETLISLGVYKQVAWERDIAIQQLHELGYEFGQKIEPTTKNDLGVDVPDNNVGNIDCISREQAKTGHWIDRDVYDADRWKCSECGRTEQYQENFCPNCGSYNGGDSNGNE